MPAPGKASPQAHRSSLHALVIPSWYPSAASPVSGIFLQEQVQALAAAGIRLGVIYPEARSLRSLSPRALLENRFQQTVAAENGIPTYRLHGWNLLRGLPEGIHQRVRQAIRLADRYIDQVGQPDLIHAHGALWAGVAAARLERRCQIPFLLTEHFSGFARSILSPRQATLARAAFAGATRIAAVSRALAHTLEQQGYAPAGAIQVVPNLVNERFFTLSPQTHTAPPFRFFSAGAFYPWKGFDLLLHAFARAFPNGGDVELILAGDGPERGRLQALAKRLGIASRVFLAGYLNREEMRRALRASHAFVQPSAYETFGVVLIEAMATGLPVVSTAQGGPAEIINPTSGLLTTERTPAALSEALSTLYRTSHRYDPEALRAETVRKFGAEAVSNRIVSLYSEVVSAYKQK